MTDNVRRLTKQRQAQELRSIRDGTIVKPMTQDEKKKMFNIFREAMVKRAQEEK